MSPVEELRCSFCEKPRHSVKHLLSGPDGVYICGECVAINSRRIADEDAREAEMISGRQRRGRRIEVIPEAGSIAFGPEQRRDDFPTTGG